VFTVSPPYLSGPATTEPVTAPTVGPRHPHLSYWQACA
jgi:hypothetical protein